MAGPLATPAPMPGPPAATARDAFGADPRSLALFRMALAILLLADLGMRARGLRLLFTDDGLLPRSVLRTIRGPEYLSLHALGGSAAFEAALFALAAVAALALLVGWGTRLATFASWALLLSLHNRNPLLQNGGDHLLRLLLFWAMFLPLNARASVDRAHDPGLRRDGPVSGVAWLGLAIQACVVYLSCAAFKGPLWREGNAVTYLLRTEYFTLPAGVALLEWPRLLRLLTWTTLALEWGVSFLLLVPVLRGRLRLLGVAALASMHLAFVACLRIGLFPLISIASVLPFLPPLFWEALGRTRLAGGVRRLSTAIDALARRLPRGPALARHGMPSRVAEPVAAFFLGYVLLLNALAHSGARRLDPVLGSLAAALRLEQPWSMFQGPKRVTGWHELAAVTEDGRPFDVLRQGHPFEARPVPVGSPNPGPPPVVRALYPEEHLFRYTYRLNLPRKRRGALHARYADLVCRTWNAAHDGGARLASVELVWAWAETLPAGRTGPLHRDVLWRQPCGGVGEPGAGGGDASDLP